MKKIGIFIGRMNPPHIGHKSIIDKSLKENYKTIVFLGSINVIDERNPLSFLERKKILDKVYKSFIDNKKLYILGIKDNPDDEIWLKDIIKKLNSIITEEAKILNIYCGDLKNDSAIRVLKKYKDLFFTKEINFIEINRNNFFIEYNSKKIKISSTLLRDNIKNGDKELIKRINLS